MSVLKLRPPKTADSELARKLLAELAGFYAFFAGFVEESVDFGL